MKTNQNFGLLFFLLVICQIILCNYACFGPYILLSMLPAMILCIPIGISTIACMMIAFASGLAVDWLSEGLLGINAASIIPAALTRKAVIKLFLGEDIIARNDTFSIRKNGLVKVSLALLSTSALFLAVYIFLDGAGTRPLWFCFARFCASLACSWPIGIMVINLLCPDDRK